MSQLTEFIQTASVAEIHETMDFLLNECTLDEAPDYQTVLHWQKILQHRGSKFEKIVQLCNSYL